MIQDARLPHILTALTYILLLFGFVMVYSSSATLSSNIDGSLPRFLTRQAGYGVIGLILFGILAKLDYPKWERIMPVAIWGVLALLVLVFSPMGYEVRGTRAWLRLYPTHFSIQPSEFAKLGLVIYLAVALKRRQDPEISFFRRNVLPTLITITVLGLIIAQGDKGMTLFIGGVVVMLWFISGARLLPIVGIFLAFALLMVVIVRNSDYAYQRWVDFTEQWSEERVEGFQPRQGKVALVSGKVLGQGIGGGLTRLPDRHTDFIFPIVGEELGFAGAAATVLAYTILIVIGLTIAYRCPDLLGTLLAGGITVLIGCQAALNLCVATGVTPTTGIGLPLLSYGGSSLISTLAGLGILVNVGQPVKGKS